MATFDSGIYTEAQYEETESVEYIGRVVLELATDPNVMQQTGQTLRTRDLGREYNLHDIDGRPPG